MSKKEKKKKRKILRIIQFILILVIIYSGKEIYKWYFDNKENDEIIKELKEIIVVDEIEENKVDVSKLKEINSDVVGYLKVNNTNIEYPVVKTTDNEYYLNHSFDKSVNGAGWIFADYTNKFDGTDRNVVIYGHNRRDGSMFSTLRNIINPEWYNNGDNLKIKFITENKELEYQIFSVYKIENEDYYIQTLFDNNSFNKFIDTIQKRSIKNFEVDVKSDDQILTLSTCDNNNKNRVVLHAVKIVK